MRVDENWKCGWVDTWCQDSQLLSSHNGAINLEICSQVFIVMSYLNVSIGRLHKTLLRRLIAVSYHHQQCDHHVTDDVFDGCWSGTS